MLAVVGRSDSRGRSNLGGSAGAPGERLGGIDHAAQSVFGIAGREEMTSSISEISTSRFRTFRGLPAKPSIGRRITNRRVSESSKRPPAIGDVVELINTIAGQDQRAHLLGAGTSQRNRIWAASAQARSGRGFAVVASEVKALAEQTAKATGEISQQIGGIQAATQMSVVAIKKHRARHHQPDVGDRPRRLRPAVRRAGRRHPGNLAQHRSTPRRALAQVSVQHRRRGARRRRNRIGLRDRSIRRRSRCRAKAAGSSSRSAKFTSCNSVRAA